MARTPMEWTGDVVAGAWLRDRLDPDGPEGGATMHAWVPRGYEAYARIFHPADRDRPVGRSWPPLPYGRHHREWAAFQADAPQIDAERVSWATVAEAFGTTMHAQAQWHGVVGSREVEGEDGPRDAAGWRYSDPPTGELPSDLVAAATQTLLAHTTTPADGFVALWEGWGGLVGHLGYGPSRVLFTAAGDAIDPTTDRHANFLATSARDQFNDVFRKPSWQPGILDDEVSRGARLRLPNRDHVLFHADLTLLADPAWPWQVPWRDTALEAPGGAASALSPSLVWPADHAWVLATEVDADSTVIAGSAAAIRAVCTDARLEAWSIDEGADLSWGGDEVNG
ncbi:hypothetical protein [Microbacterium invictum]|uniref:DUF317 domain-containing protein n=1 Tax=Microbacterium invictum TaxID=515415 RepID=A0ABZ0VAK0_9MICO|nr:hypothetical protein [Microbacterium invictum]WQB70356.1 hypothetical protein T9R20_16925 [Microbacterium invictum]